MGRSGGLRDLLHRQQSILRNYPVLGHARFMLEKIRPEIQQYFIETDTGGTPFDRETRDLVYARAKGEEDAEPFGTQHDVNAVGYEFVTHSLRAKMAGGDIPQVTLGGPRCTQPYDIAMLNVSAMSFARSRATPSRPSTRVLPSAASRTTRARVRSAPTTSSMGAT